MSQFGLGFMEETQAMENISLHAGVPAKISEGLSSIVKGLSGGLKSIFM